MKKIVCIITALLALLLPAAVLAEGESIISNPDFSSWQEGLPEGWTFSSSNAYLTSENQEVSVILESPGYAQLYQTISLEKETSYKVTLEAAADSGAALSFLYQQASVPVNGNTTVLYVRTNTCDTQNYALCLSLGSEYEEASGAFNIKNVSIEKLEEMPQNETVYTLLGEIGPDGAAVSESTEDTAQKEPPSYNALGPALLCVILIAALYFFATGYYGRKFADSVKISRAAIVTAFMLAFVLRLFIAIKVEGYSTDLSCFKGWARLIHEHGLSGFYEADFFSDYPPAYMYVLWVLGGLQRLFSIPSGVMTVIIKLPAILSDLGLAYIAYRFSKKHIGAGSGILMSITLLISPLLIIVSSAWAQIDSVFTLITVCIFILLYKNKNIAAFSLWMLLLLTKPQALLIAPVMAFLVLYELIKKDTRKAILKDILISIPIMFAIYTVVSLPMKGNQGFFYVFTNMFGTMGEYNYASVNAFNFFSLLGANFKNADSAFLFTNYSTAGWVFIALSTVAAGTLYFIKGDRKNIFSVGALYLSSIFMFAHQMHERYIYPAVILLLFAAIIYNSRKIFASYLALSATSFLNIYTVLVYNMADSGAIDDALTRFLSLLNLAAFIWTAYCVIKAMLNKDNSRLSYNETIPEPFSARSLKSAKNRLNDDEISDKSAKLNKKDFAIMLAVTVIYAVVAFVNLGSTDIPCEAPKKIEAGESAVLELKDNAYIESLWYYAGYCEGDINISLSDDGVNFYAAANGFTHEYSDMFTFRKNELNSSAKYIMLSVTTGGMDIREMGVTGEDGEFISPENAYYTDKSGNRTQATFLIDEFDKLPHDGTSYMEEMYFDEVYHARTAYEYINGIYPYEITHPPLGKAFIALGCMIFGFNPFGWRFFGALAGVLMLPVMYIFVKRLFKSTKWAFFATALFSCEFMHYVQTRIATIDSFSVLFIMLMYLCMYEYSRHSIMKEKLSKTLLPLGLSGLFFALGAATKWVCLYAAPGLAILFFYTVYQREKEYRYVKENGLFDEYSGYRKKLWLTILFCVGVFLALPAAVYILSYYPYYNAMQGDYTLADVWKNQVYMLTYHANLSGDPHPYQSSVYTWPFNIRPVFFFLAKNLDPSLRSVIWCMGSPTVFTCGTLMALGLFGVRKQPKTPFKGLAFITVCLLGQLLPWVLITREVFIYHFFTSVPFLIIMITYFMRYICERYKKGKYFAAAFLALSVVLFILFYPPLTGTPMSVFHARLIRWSPLWPISL